MFWFDKTDPRALFLDKRRETCTDPRGREVVVDPDILGDFTNLPFEDSTFSLVVFDPPHTFNGANSAMAQKYGRLEPGWREQITLGFSECFRVLCAGGTLIFKWNEHRVPIKTVLAMTPERPLFGHRSGSAAKTHWLVFMKPLEPLHQVSDQLPNSNSFVSPANILSAGSGAAIAHTGGPAVGLLPPFHTGGVNDV
jgi:SAM-dependent methyltransferase